MKRNILIIGGIATAIAIELGSHMVYGFGFFGCILPGGVIINC